ARRRSLDLSPRASGRRHAAAWCALAGSYRRAAAGPALMRLQCAYHHNPRIQPLVDGAVKLDGYDCEWEVGDAADLHLRHLNENAFDVFEFSLSNLYITKSRPDRAHLRWLGIPTF